MIGRYATIALTGAIALFGPVGAAIAAGGSPSTDRSDDVVVYKRDDDDDDVITAFARDDDDDDRGDDTGTNDSRTSGVNSNDRTNSRKTPVSRDRELTGDRRREADPVRVDVERHTSDDVDLRMRHEALAHQPAAVGQARRGVLAGREQQ